VRPTGTSLELLEEVFSAVGIPFTVQRKRPFRDAPTGRALLGLLRCVPGRDGEAATGELGDLLAWLRAPGLLEQQSLVDWLELACRRAGAQDATRAREVWQARHWRLDVIDQLEQAQQRGPVALLDRAARELYWLFCAPRRSAAEVLGSDERDEARALAAGRRALAELVDRGIRADRVYGASVGAINGAAYASNPTPEGIERMAEIWRKLKGDDIFPRSVLDGPWLFLQKRPAVHANTGLRTIIEEGIDFEQIEDAAIPFELVTTSLTDGRERWIAHGNAVEAILASSAIPSIFPPVTIDGDVLVDGGVVNNVPISRALAAGCTRIFVLLCGPLHYYPRPAKRPAEAALTAFFVAIHARFVRELTAIPPGVEVVVFSGGGEPSAQYRDFSGTATMIKEGRAEVAEVLDRYAGTSQDVTVPKEARR